MERLDPETIKQIKDHMNRDPLDAAGKIDYFLSITPFELKIGITGEGATGKSSFINALREMQNNEEAAAPVGVKESTLKVSPYRHPDYPNTIFYDFPGINTTKWPRETYVKKIGFEKYDFFIIVSETLFKEDDVNLAKEIQKMGKRFYFVHSKIEQTLRNEEKNEKNLNAEEILKEIRKRRIIGLVEQGFKDPKVFLLDNFQHKSYDFCRLRQTLKEELKTLTKETKKSALLCVMANIHQEVINKKKEKYKAGIKYYCAVSAVGAAVPIPGVSVALDIGMIVKAVLEYVTGFGLDESSLRKLAKKTNVKYDDLRFTIQSVLAMGEITQDVILKLLTQLGSTSLLIATEEWTRYIPILGIPIAAGLSYTVTHRALNYFLDELACEAQRVYKRALDLHKTT